MEEIRPVSDLTLAATLHGHFRELKNFRLNWLKTPTAKGLMKWTRSKAQGDIPLTIRALEFVRCGGIFSLPRDPRHLPPGGEVRAEYFTGASLLDNDPSPDVVVSRHVIEHVPDPTVSGAAPSDGPAV